MLGFYNRMKTTSIFLFLLFMSLNAFSQDLNGVILVPANPQWEYAPYSKEYLFPRPSSAYGRIFYFEDSTFYVFSGYLTRNEATNHFGLSDGDGGFVYKGTYQKKEDHYILKYECKYDWIRGHLLKADDLTDILSDKFIPMGGLYPYPVYKINDEYYCDSSKSKWILIPEALDRVKNYFFSKLNCSAAISNLPENELYRRKRKINTKPTSEN